MNSNLENLILILGHCEVFLGLERLHHTIFLMQKQTKLFSYSFKRGNYGPACQELNQDLNLLINMKLISSDYSSQTHEKTYRLTILGYQIFHKSLKLLPDSSKFLLNKIKHLSKNEARNLIYKTAKVYEFEIGDFMPT